MLLEEPLIRTPYELLRRSHRSAQRQVEKDFIAVQTLLQSLTKSLSKGSSGEEVIATAMNKIDQATDRIRGLRRKLDDLQPNEITPTPLARRLAYLDKLTAASATLEIKEVETKDATDITKPDLIVDKDGDTPMESNPEIRDGNTLDRFIVDYLLRSGRMKAARALAEKENIEHLCDIKLFAELVKIENALLERHSCTEALAWCGENRGTLKKTKNNLEFTLRMQEFIELCRKRDIAGAIAYSRKSLSPWAGTHMVELRQAMTLLAFGERTGVNVYRSLYEPSRWDFVRAQFRDTFLTLYALPSQSLLALSLSAGLSSLRVPACAPYKPASPTRSTSSPVLPSGSMSIHGLDAALGLPAGDAPMSLDSILAAVRGNLGQNENRKEKEKEVDQSGNIDCPTCAENMKVLAAEVPLSHHMNSTIVCRISGEVMDSQNGPMAFPNGYVYSYNALAAMAKNNFGIVTCPRTKETCQFTKLRKVYIS
ncbi:hypothetical protein TREMEDRAFT_28694 [Tremella mesenterica DSM 1558]|uniref:uncharacterized protein n=1 Tax=Tremella mesenterica (strain ATCC 24925 / CBS 8224 / DSM 1558 / NBRC 9311 / NRRL Y-6157 / RJB 2259-6 / UBC 559-6) TaxID=578456 RepID=UPI0003F48FB1|nr:uncharacterized protein TREMEDRAFT_28694 [Tremella mesenterica DSM 1558]EIW70604.1 hypothetical protein TREMEDRAFT_28694 [Tremella mesenterica DSM 1558]